MLVSNTLVFLRDYPVEYNTKLSVLYGFQRGLRSLDSNTPATDDRRQTACQSGLSSQLAVNTDFVYFYRAMLSIRGTSHGPVSVCLSVCPSQVGVLLKRLNVGSHKQHHTIPQGL